MSLLDNAMESCTMLDRSTAPDGRGGIVTAWVDGAQFQAATTFDSSMQGRVAAAQGVTNLYTVTTRRTVNLQYHDIFRRERDGKIFRVTSDGDDKATPTTAGLDMRQVSAEEFELPRVTADG